MIRIKTIFSIALVVLALLVSNACRETKKEDGQNDEHMEVNDGHHMEDDDIHEDEEMHADGHMMDGEEMHDNDTMHDEDQDNDHMKDDEAI